MEDYNRAIEAVKEMIAKDQRVEEIKNLIDKYEQECEKK